MRRRSCGRTAPPLVVARMHCCDAPGRGGAAGLLDASGIITWHTTLRATCDASGRPSVHLWRGAHLVWGSPLAMPLKLRASRCGSAGPHVKQAVRSGCEMDVWMEVQARTEADGLKAQSGGQAPGQIPKSMLRCT